MKVVGRNRAAAVLLLVALVFATLAALIVPAAVRWKEHGDIIRENRAKIAQADETRRSFMRLTRASNEWTVFSQQERTGFIFAESSDEAMQTAETYVSSTIAGFGGTVRAIETGSAESPREGVESMTISVTADIPKAVLAQMMTSLEEMPPFVLVNTFKASSLAEDTLRIVLNGKLQRFIGGPT